MKSLVFSIFLVFSLIACNSTTSTKKHPSNRLPEHSVVPDSVIGYMNAALDTMREHSINADVVNWRNVKDSVFDHAVGASSYKDTYDALASGLTMLNDNHSFFKTPEEAMSWENEATIVKRKKNRKPESRFSGLMLDSIAKITVNSYSSGNLKDNLDYCRQLQQLIRYLDSRNPKGWIVDLRYNRGGNMWPMLAGISPLLREGILGRFISNDNKTVSWFYRNGKVGTSEGVMLVIPNPYRIKGQDLPLAVLVGKNTASSGEALLLSFRDRPNTIIIGAPTSGQSTANKIFKLKDDAQLILTTAVFADNNGQKYGSRIKPDIDVSTRWYIFRTLEYQIVINEAKRWILDR